MAMAPEQAGIGIRRFHTTAGMDPYDLVPWEVRDARITNFRDGSVAFEQLGVEVPADWSLNATNILAQKYFRGSPGNAARERSLKQVADRVVDTIADWGARDGYFVDGDEAQAFADELKYLIVTQRAAFNSPVWFNIGVPGVPQQGAACFILSVDDTMDSILNWYVEEGTIFKGGSGAGVNLSRIRSSVEALKGGGTASGPVSFMRGADASAGTIKSGGTTRRAAKMVILDVDHPDIEEFVWCKASEEQKARVLRDAGFDMDLDGRDSHSVQYQNANNSVRVTDAFMQAVLDDADWHLKAVTTGDIVKTVRARDLMRQIAQATWECADPGMQFDTTINHWHTAANTGRINASNPCSEYMSLDNSACNLASINLLRYLDSDGRFAVDEFRHAVEVVFTAQEIIVGNADYPTKRIGDTSRRFRQLGIGYANLGAMLMALGLPYDSDEGRAWAGAVTALMTGHAYLTSARTAARMGPFAGYSENEEHMLRVLGQHREATAHIDEELVPHDLLSAAQEAWDGACDLGALYGVRNSQASVLAPTGTIGLLMDCDTTGIEPDLGLVKMKKLVGGGTMSIVNQTIPRALRRLGYTDTQVDAIIAYIDEHKSIVGAPHLDPEHLAVFACSMGDNTIHYLGHVKMMAAVQSFISGAISKCITGDSLLTTADGLVRIGSLHDGEAPDTFRDRVLEVASLGRTAKSDAFYFGGPRRVRRVVLRSGHAITGTLNHRVLVGSDSGLEWKCLDEVEPGDMVAVQYGADLWSPLPALLDDFAPCPAYGSHKSVRIPREMTEELAFLLGAYAAEGHTTASNWTVHITSSVPAVRERVARAWRDLFAVEPVIASSGDRCPQVRVASKTIVEFLDHLGCGRLSASKRIPDAVLRSPREMVLAFLQGLSLDAHVSVGSMPKWAICLDSKGMLDDLQAVLTNLGIVHGRISKWNREYAESYDEVYCTGANASRLASLVPFMEPDKASKAIVLQQREISNRHNGADIVPGGGQGDLRLALDRLSAIEGVELPPWVATVLNDGLHFSPVDSVDDAGESEVFDISVPTTHAFVANGIMNHNTVNLPEEVTVEEVEQLHIEAWQLGLKAVAIYRDNCKVAQPLSTAKKEGESAGTPGAAAAEAVRVVEKVVEKVVERVVEKVVEVPVRERMPRTRSSRTFDFRVADCKGFVTVGEYEDGRPGEIFVKVSKQGSTLAGIMDAFAIAISHGLQYGVPLRSYVEAFTGMRFEPAGMTDDPDIRIANSLMDYLFRRLAVMYLSKEERAELNIFTTQERMQPTLPGVEETAVETVQGHDVAPDPPSIESASALAARIERQPSAPSPERASDAPMCMQCGVQMQRAGSCHACPCCGTTSGCS